MTVLSADPLELISISSQPTTVDGEIIDKDKVAVDRIVLDVLGRKRIDANVTKSIIDARVRETMSGAPTFSVSLHDPNLEFLNSKTLYYLDDDGDRRVRAIEVTIDRRQYRLVQISWASSDPGVDVTLTFEHKLVSLLRLHDKPRKAVRGSVTLPEFIRSLAREITQMDVRFISPGLHKKSVIQKAKKDDSKDEDRDPALGADVVFVKGKRATPSQRKVIDAVLKAGMRLDAPRKVLVVAIMVITQESLAGQENVSVSGMHFGPFHQDSSYGTEAQRRDPFHASTSFCRKAIALDKKYPNLSYSELAEKVQISGQGKEYEQWKEEAQDTVSAFGGTGGESITVVEDFLYTRGEDGKPEDSWDCSQRYAQLVNYRSFVTGVSSWYFTSEPVLFKSRSRMLFTPQDGHVLDNSGDVDEGKRSKTITFTVIIARWKAPPGSVVTVKGYGVADGRWLVEDIDRSLYEDTAQVTLKKPTKPKAEPANETSTETLSGDTPSDLVRLVQICRKFTGPYDYGGGHGPSLSSLTYSQGLDCSSSVSKALYEAGLFKAGPALVSGGFSSWGEPGKGQRLTVWYHSGHVWMEFHVNGKYYRFDTSSYGSGGSGPRLRSTHRPTAGFSARHPKGF